MIQRFHLPAAPDDETPESTPRKRSELGVEMMQQRRAGSSFSCRLVALATAEVAGSAVAGSAPLGATVLPAVAGRIGGADGAGHPGPARPALLEPRRRRWSVVSTIAPRVRDAAEQLRATSDARLARDIALLAIRIVLAWIFIYHGASTLFGAFGSSGIHGQTVFFNDVAHLHPAKFFAVLSGIIEFFGGIGVGLGIFGRLAAAGLFGDMVIAMITVTWRNGIV